MDQPGLASYTFDRDRYWSFCRPPTRSRTCATCACRISPASPLCSGPARTGAPSATSSSRSLPPGGLRAGHRAGRKPPPRKASSASWQPGRASASMRAACATSRPGHRHPRDRGRHRTSFSPAPPGSARRSRLAFRCSWISSHQVWGGLGRTFGPIGLKRRRAAEAAAACLLRGDALRRPGPSGGSAPFPRSAPALALEVGGQRQHLPAAADPRSARSVQRR